MNTLPATEIKKGEWYYEMNPAETLGEPAWQQAPANFPRGTQLTVAEAALLGLTPPKSERRVIWASVLEGRITNATILGNALVGAKRFVECAEDEVPHSRESVMKAIEVASAAGTGPASSWIYELFAALNLPEGAK